MAGRASTEDQDASRAKDELEAFAKDRGATIASHYVENVIGASLQRPELFRLLKDCQPGDVLLVEQVDMHGQTWRELPLVRLSWFA